MAESDKFRGRIIGALRKLSFSWKPRNEAKKRQQMAPATFKCEKCGVWVYEGSSEENYLKICLTYPKERVIMNKVAIDHIKAVIEPSVGWVSWDSYIERMFCSSDNYQVLCILCHSIKSNSEIKIRKETRIDRKK